MILIEKVLVISLFVVWLSVIWKCKLNLKLLKFIIVIIIILQMRQLHSYQERVILVMKKMKKQIDLGLENMQRQNMIN